jgi:hypothetical protein
VCALARSPREAVGLLAARLPADRLDAGQVRRWIDDLDAESFARRRGAERRLAGLGVRVEGDLFDALKRRPSLEARQRLGRLLDRTEAVGPEALRLGRAIEALERIGSGQAVRLLQRLAQGHTGGRTTREAREALARLRRGPGAS